MYLSFILQRELQELQKRLVVLGCQLRKAEVSKRTYEVATEKLINFAEVGNGADSEKKKRRALPFYFNLQDNNNILYFQMVHESLTEGNPGK